jgi:hypothetical protein
MLWILSSPRNTCHLNVSSLFNCISCQRAFTSSLYSALWFSCHKWFLFTKIILLLTLEFLRFNLFRDSRIKNSLTQFTNVWNRWCFSHDNIAVTGRDKSYKLRMLNESSTWSNKFQNEGTITSSTGHAVLPKLEHVALDHTKLTCSLHSALECVGSQLSLSYQSDNSHILIPAGLISLIGLALAKRNHFSLVGM